MNMADGAPPKQAGIAEYLRSDSRSPLFLSGDALEILRSFPSGCGSYLLPIW